jgi:hypothetical protein
MGAWIMELSAHRLYRDLFWLLASIAPGVLLGYLTLVLVPRYRRRAATALLLNTAVALLAASVFHVGYARVIWGGHDSAIRFLDEGALRAGFAASAMALALGWAVRAALRTSTRPLRG